MVARDLESLDRNMRFTFPHLQEVIPLSKESVWHRSTGWATGSVGVGIGQHTAIRLRTAGIHGLALYAPLDGMADIRQDGRRYSPQSRQSWMLFNEYPAQADTVATSGITVGLQRDRLQSTYDTMSGAPGRPIVPHSLVLNLHTTAGRRASQDLPLLLHCSADASRRWPVGLPLAEEMVYRFVAGLLLDEHQLSRSAIRQIEEKRCVDLSCAFMVAALSQSISLTDVERVTGVGARALQLAFLRCLGLSPMRWLKEQRLLQARHMILQNRDVPISQVAVACGLNHFGRFAADFKGRFGINPSDISKVPELLH